METPSPRPPRLRPTAETPLPGLAYYEQRREHPLATVICVHGGLDRGGSFVRLARRLTEFDVVAYDRRGYQGSRGLRPLGLTYQVDDLVAVAEFEARRGPVIAFGHSYGGLIAIGAALRTSTPIDMIVDYESPIPSIVPVLVAQPSDDSSFETVVDSFFQRLVSKEAWEKLGDAERESRRMDGAALVSDLGSLHQELPFDVSALTTPLVYLRGDQHGFEYYQEMTTKLDAMFPNVTVISLPNTPHAAHLRNADSLAAIITEQWHLLRDRT